MLETADSILRDIRSVLRLKDSNGRLLYPYFNSRKVLIEKIKPICEIYISNGMGIKEALILACERFKKTHKLKKHTWIKKR